MKNSTKVSFIILGPILVMASIYLIGSFGMPSGSGPSPQVVISVSSGKNKLDEVISELDDFAITEGLTKVNMHSSESERFSYYEVAYWYSQDDSKYYGFSLVKWLSSEITSDYLISVYSESPECALCIKTIEHLKASEIEYEVK